MTPETVELGRIPGRGTYSARNIVWSTEGVAVCIVANYFIKSPPPLIGIVRTAATYPDEIPRQRV